MAFGSQQYPRQQYTTWPASDRPILAWKSNNLATDQSPDPRYASVLPSKPVSALLKEHSNYVKPVQVSDQPRSIDSIMNAKPAQPTPKVTDNAWSSFTSNYWGAENIGNMPWINKDIVWVQGSSFNSFDDTTKNAIRDEIVTNNTGSVGNDQSLEDLTIDMKNVVSEGRTVDIEKLKKLYPEYSHLDDNVLTDLTADISNVIKEWRTIDMDKLKKLYPELSQPESTLSKIDKSLSDSWSFSDVISGKKTLQAYLGDKIKAWLYETGKWLVQAGIEWTKAWADLLNRASNAESGFLDKTFWTDTSKYNLATDPNQTAGTDLLHMVTNATNIAAAAVLPWAIVEIGAVSKIPWIEQALEAISKGSSKWVWLVTSHIPWFDKLSQEDQDAVNGAIANSIMTVVWARSGVKKDWWIQEWSLIDKGIKKVDEIWGKIKEKANEAFDMTGLKPEEKALIQNNPYFKDSFDNFRKSQSDDLLTPQERHKQQVSQMTEALVAKVDDLISEKEKTWPLYEELKKNPKEFSFEPIKASVSEIISKNDIKVNRDWSLDFSESNIGSQADMSKIQRAFDRINDHWDTTSAKRALNLRQAIDDMAGWEKDATPKASYIIKSMRKAVDDIAKKEVPWLKEADDMFSKQITELKEIKKWLTDKEWNALAGAYSKVKNANTLANTTFAEKLEKYYPWVKERIEAINSSVKLWKKFEISPRASEISKHLALLWSIVWYNTHWLFGWVGGLIIWHFVERLFTNLTEKWLNKIKISQIEKLINTITPEQIKTLEIVWEAIKKWKAVSNQQKQQLQDTLEKIQKAVGDEKQKINTDKLEQKQKKLDIEQFIKDLEPQLKALPEKASIKPIGTKDNPIVAKAPEGTLERRIQDKKEFRELPQKLPVTTPDTPKPKIILDTIVEKKAVEPVSNDLSQTPPKSIGDKPKNDVLSRAIDKVKSKRWLPVKKEPVKIPEKVQIENAVETSSPKQELINRLLNNEKGVRKVLEDTNPGMPEIKVNDFIERAKQGKAGTDEMVRKILDKLDKKPLAKSGKGDIIDSMKDIKWDIEVLADWSIKVQYIRNTEKMPYRGDKYLQDIEPKWQYFNISEWWYNPNWRESWEKVFKKPLVIENWWSGKWGWKEKLSQQYWGKKWQALSNAIKNDWYDWIITYDVIKWEKFSSESVDLSTSKWLPTKLSPLHEEARKYKTVEEFIESQPKLYRWEVSWEAQLTKNSDNKSNMLWDAFHFTTDKKLASQFWNTKEIPFMEDNIIKQKDIDSIIKKAKVRYDELESKWIYEWDEYDMLENVVIGKYPDIAKYTGKPFIKTGRYNDTEVLYFQEVDNTRTQLRKIREEANK